jgi:hypothetical protein
MNERSSSVCGIISIVLAALNGLALLVFAVGGLHMRGRFLEIYQDLLSGESLPGATQLVLTVPAWSVLLIAVLLLGILSVKELIRPKWIPLCLNLLWFLIGGVVFFVFSAVLMAPLMTIIQQIGNGQP